MTTGSALAKAGCKYLGRLYSEMDCQAFVERALKDVGISKDLPGSNAWFRTMNWTGTPEECKSKYGKIPVGAFLFILEHDGKEPSKYQGDGVGNASHIGIYTDMSGAEMVSLALSEGDSAATGCDYGNGAIHSSSSRGKVCTSKFSGKTINGGWNRIGLWTDAIDYGSGSATQLESETEISGGEVASVGIVYAESGSTVKLRQKPSSSCSVYWDIPIGNEIQIDSDSGEWVKGSAWDKKGTLRFGYMKKQFVRMDIPNEQKPSNEVYYCVTIPHLTAQQLEGLEYILAPYNVTIEEERG